jgi:hypothetical protein
MAKSTARSKSGAKPRSTSRAASKAEPVSRAPKPIVFVLTERERARLKKIGLRNHTAAIVRVKYVNGRLLITHHRIQGAPETEGGGHFVPSNAAFA